MAAARKATPWQEKSTVYGKQLAQLASIRDMVSMAAVASGEFSVQQIKTASATENLTEKIRKQKLTFNEARKSLGLFKKAWLEQERLQNASLSQFTNNVAGKNRAEIFIPNSVPRTLESARVQFGYINEALRSISHQTVNWGKNTQWAGRQIMVGIGVPLGLLAVGASAAAYQVDKELTRIQKVYDTTAQNFVADDQKVAASTRELAQLRKDSLQASLNMAKEYGAAVKDTLATEADLAAVGLQGRELLKATAETTRIATLGEVDRQTALNMTIALQTAFKLSSEELTDTFNYMNAVENATSLGIKDIAEAVPRAASALSSLGVSAKEMTVMMVAMKESGIDAEEGANALKSASTRILNPVRSAVDIFEQYGIDLESILERSQGNIYKYLAELGKAMEGLTDLQKQQAIAKLFGTYQFNRLNALLGNLGDAATGAANQTSKAMELLGMSTAEGAALADRELTRFQESASGKMKIAIETFKGQLAELGEPFLKIASTALSLVNKILEFFNNMSPVSKQIVMWIALAMGLAGPLIMITGVMANLIGSAGKMATAIAALIIKFKLITPEEKAAELQALRMRSAMDQGTAAITEQTIALRQLTAMMQNYNRAAGMTAMGAPLPTTGFADKGSYSDRTFGIYQTPSGNLRGTGGKIIGNQNSPKVRAARELAHAEAIAEEKARQTAGHAAKTERSYKGAAVALGMFGIGAAAMLTAANGSEEMAGNMTKAYLVGTALTMLPWGGIWKGAKMGAGSIGNILSGTTKLGPVLMRVAGQALKFFGPAGILAGGVLLVMKINNEMNKMQKAQDRINESGKDWAKILGFTYQEGKGPGDPEGTKESIGEQANLTKQLREENEDLAKALENAATEQDKVNLAIREGMKIVASGGTAMDAEKAVRTALDAAGISGDRAEELVANIKLRINFDDPESLVHQATIQMQNILDQAAAQVDQRNIWEKIFGATGASDAAMAKGKEAVRTFWSGFSTLDANSPEGRQAASQMLRDLQGNFDKQAEPIFNDMKKQFGEAFETLDIDNMEELITVLNAGRSAWAGNSEALAAFSKLSVGATEDVRQFNEVQHNAIMEFARLKGIPEDVAKGFSDFRDVAKHLGLDFLTVAEAQKKWELQQREFTRGGYQASEATRLAALNVLRLAAGLPEATGLAQGFGVALRSAADDAEEYTNAINDAAQATGQDLANSLRDSMSGSMGSIYGEAARIMDNQIQSEIDAIERRGDARQKRIEANGEAQEAALDRKREALDAAQKAEDKAFEKKWDSLMESHDDRWKARMDTEEAAYDSRIDKIKEAIDAEEEAERVRERIFEAEQRRIERLSQMFSRNIDFNAALNSGNLDEAARIMSDVNAQQSQWSIDDQRDRAGTASDQRRDALNAQIDAIEQEKDARLDALEKMEEAEKERLQAIKEREQEALQAKQAAQEKALENERKAVQKSIAAQKERAQEETRANVNAAQTIWETKKRKLEQELETLKAFTPRNEAELKAHIGRVEAKYQEYGIHLRGQGNQWGQYVGNALRSNVDRAAAALRNEINWREIGAKITNDMAASFGITGPQLLQWLKTGIFPETQNKNLGTLFKDGIEQMVRGYNRARHTGGLVFHTGGSPGFSQADRVGIPRSASPYPSEVPALLKRGEFVVNEKATRNNLPLLTAINSGAFGARHSGGLSPALNTMNAGPTASAVASGLSQGIASSLSSFLALMSLGAFANSSTYGATGPGKFERGGNWPPIIPGRISANTAAARAFIREHWPETHNGGDPSLGRRDSRSDHGKGKALDIFPGTAFGKYASGAGLARGWQIANWFVNNAGRFGTKYVIWQRKINTGTGWREYTRYGDNPGPTLGHFDHVHLSVRHRGGPMDGEGILPYGMSIPQLSVGANILQDNVLANLHKGEKVLTAPLSQKLDVGLDNLANGAGTVYDIDIDMRGAYVNKDLDIKRAVWEAIEEREQKNGRSRRVGTK